MTLKLDASDVGKRFKRRDGGIETVTEFHPGKGFPVEMESANTYTNAGRYELYNKHSWDLVERLPEEPAVRFELQPQGAENNSVDELRETFNAQFYSKPQTLADAIAALNPAHEAILELSDGTEFAECRLGSGTQHLDFGDGNYLDKDKWHLFPAPEGLRIRKPATKVVSHVRYLVLFPDGEVQYYKTRGMAEHVMDDYHGAQVHEISWNVRGDKP